MSEQFKIEIQEATNGFMRGEFKDFSGNQCLVKESILGANPAIKLGPIHLTQPMARTLIRILMRFVNNGTIAEIEQIDKETFAEKFGLYVASMDALKDADGRKLLWLFKNLPDIDPPVMSPASAIIGAIEDMLYPEYDGDKVKMTDTGWSTPEGEINYL